jgi:glycine cleavage system H protein
MNFPAELYYTPDHEWLRIDGDVATVGITDFAQKELGDIVFLEIGTVGKSLKAHEVFGTIEAVKTVSDLYLPIDAQIAEFNKDLETQPELVNNDPYGKGWIVKIKLTGKPDMSKLLKADKYKELVAA